MYYKLRVDIKTDRDVYLEMERKYFQCYVRSEEGEEVNPHFHYYIELLPGKTPVGLRQFIREKIGRGNGCYSLQALDEEKPIEYISYIIKQNPTRCVWYLFPSDKREEIENYSIQVNKDIKRKKQSKVGKLVEYMGDCDLTNKRSVVEKVLSYYIENKLIIREHIIRAEVETVLISNSDEYLEQYKRKILNNIFS